MPIEQAFLLPTLNEYKKSVALLSRWSAYSRFALVVIPRGTSMNAYAGVVAPQLLIENPVRQKIIKKAGVHGYEDEVKLIIKDAEEYAEKYLKELEDSSLSEAEIVEIRTKIRNSFYEFYPGGATQIYIDYVEKYHLFDIDLLYKAEKSESSKTEKHRPFNANFSTERVRKKEERGFWVPPRGNGKESHFLNNDASVQIQVHEGLRKLLIKGHFPQKDFDDPGPNLYDLMEALDMIAKDIDAKRKTKV